MILYCCLTRQVFTPVHISGFFLDQPLGSSPSADWLRGRELASDWSGPLTWLSQQAASTSSLSQAGASCRYYHSFLQTRKFLWGSQYFLLRSHLMLNWSKYAHDGCLKVRCEQCQTRRLGATDNPRPCLTLCQHLPERAPTQTVPVETKLLFR